MPRFSVAAHATKLAVLAAVLVSIQGDTADGPGCGLLRQWAAADQRTGMTSSVFLDGPRPACAGMPHIP